MEILYLITLILGSIFLLFIILIFYHDLVINIIIKNILFCMK